MSDVRSPLHQPPNPDDLRRVPPAGPACAQVRGLLRDFADNDLAATEHRLVEEHVHTCFACAVELSRAEHEVFRLRRGFAASYGPALPADFAHRVVDRILDAAPVGGGAGADALGSVVGRGFGADGLGAGVDESNAGRANGARPHAVRSGHLSSAMSTAAGGIRHRPAFLVAAAALLLVCVGALAMWSGWEQGPDASARLVVMRAKGAFGTSGRLYTGGSLGEQQVLQVGPGGSAKFDWHDLSSGSQPAATLEMNGRGRLRMQKGAPLLLDGTVAIETNRSVDIPVADGSTIQLGIGDYVIVADSPLPVDDYLAQLRDPMSSAPEDLRIQIEVLRGDPARIVRSDVGPTLVAAGSVGIYGGVSGVSVHPSGNQVAVGAGTTRTGSSPSPVVPTTPTLSASVYQRSGLPSVGTQVVAAFPSNGLTRLLLGATNAYGSVVLTSDATIESDFAILHAVPAQLEYGVIAPDVYPLLRDGVHVRTEQSLVLDLAEPLQGTVVDAVGQPRMGVRVLPCIIDELFGDIFPVNVNIDSTWTDEQGRFQMRRLAAALPYYQHLALVLGHPELQSTVVPVPVRGGANALLPMPPIVMQDLLTVKLRFPEANAEVRVWEEVPDLPVGRTIWERRFQTNQHGVVHAARVGRGDLYYVPNGSNPVLWRMMEVGSGPIPEFQTAITGSPQQQLFRPMENLTGTDLYIGGSFRHERFALPVPTTAANAFTMVVRDALDRPVPSAQVFAVTLTGPRSVAEGRFLGLTSSQGVISVEPVRYQGDLIVIGPDGSIALVANPQASLPRLDARLASPGRVLLPASMRPDAAAGPVVTLRFQLQFTAMPGIEVIAVRFASQATGWEFAGLAPGLYSVEVNGQTHTVLVPADGFAILQ